MTKSFAPKITRLTNALRSPNVRAIATNVASNSPRSSRPSALNAASLGLTHPNSRCASAIQSGVALPP
jgi:hypothetical protein